MVVVGVVRVRTVIHGGAEPFQNVLCCLVDIDFELDTVVHLLGAEHIRKESQALLIFPHPQVKKMLLHFRR